MSAGYPLATEIAGKCLEIIREMLPKADRVAVLGNSTDAFTKPFLEQHQIAARTIRFDFQATMIRGAEKFDVAFGQMDKEQVAAVIIQPSLRPRTRAIDLARKYRLLSVSSHQCVYRGRWLDVLRCKQPRTVS
jgi:putative ABC transport system substrate-binding protein